MSKINLKSVVWKEGRYYVSQCLDVDVSSFGKTKKEALKSLKEALELYFEDSPLTKKERANLDLIIDIGRIDYKDGSFSTHQTAKHLIDALNA